MLVFLIDLDGTIQGDVTNQIKEHKLLSLINNFTNNSYKLKQNLKDLQDDMRNNLLRPFFQSFMKLIQTDFKGEIEIFVYTHSEKKWAYKMISVIESVINCKINRPILTRNHCINSNTNHIKSISKVQRLIENSLLQKYQHIKSKSDLNLDIYLIDNKSNLIASEQHRLIKCPTYNYKTYCNPMRNIPHKIVDKYHKLISNELLHRTYSNTWEMQSVFFASVCKHVNIVKQTNNPYNNDIYWKKIIQQLLIYKTNKITRSQLIKSLKGLYK